jgi:uncharacterized protein
MMMPIARPLPPADAAARRAAPPSVVYDIEALPPVHLERLFEARKTLQKVSEIIVPPRDGGAFSVAKGQFFRILNTDGPQVADLNLWNAHDLTEHLFTGKTRALHATHVSTGDRLWSTMPHLRAMATITYDTLAWYGWDEDGAGIHDVIGTRCDPYTHHLLKSEDRNTFCHSNLVRALAAEAGLTIAQAEPLVHDVLNVFMCTGFTRDTKKYFTKASPVRPGDFIEFFAEMDLIGAISVCPGGDCGSTQGGKPVACYPLKVEVFSSADVFADWVAPSGKGYSGRHGA